MKSHIFYRLMTHFYKDHCRNTFWNSKCLPQFKLKYDYVIAFKGDDLLTICLADKFICKNTFLWIHADIQCDNRFTHYYTQIIQKYTGVIFVSTALKMKFSSIFPNYSGKKIVIRNLLNPNFLYQRATENGEITEFDSAFLAILTVGRLSEEKGQALVPQVAKVLLDNAYPIKWYLIGDGSLRPELEQKIADLGMQEHVILLGTKENPYPYMKACDVYVQTSFSEGFGLTVAEAKILHKPIVTTDAGVMSEQITNGETGIIIPEATSEALYEGIKTMLDHPELREKFVRNLENEKYDTSKEMQKLYDFIESD